MDPILYRRRLIPDECILLKDDKILVCNEEYILTSWRAFHPKSDLHHGYSLYLLKEGIKVSKFYREDGSLRHYYCDIVEYVYDEPSNTLTSIDLLADVIIKPNGFVKVVDLDELVEAKEKKLLTEKQVSDCLLRLNRLLTTIYAGEFSRFTDLIDKQENK